MQRARSLRNNLRIVGLPEGEEGVNPTQFIEESFRTMIAAQGSSTIFVIERAHRVPTHSPPPGAPPHPMVAQILNFRDQDHLLRIVQKEQLSR
ncbi:hypothetical protein NDU88_008255 [Pleurodeles waltl]|uniref:Uncharacterized protein n=1 Tax=Pleurodeles waltl TaxID=8319 RepID=A0AAV7QMZ5_PLEWA|nr:hypothetical protein NDU88_008255 [Pleurodeles waltl]